jgi:hypothetical protein
MLEIDNAPYELKLSTVLWHFTRQTRSSGRRSTSIGIKPALISLHSKINAIHLAEHDTQRLTAQVALTVCQLGIFGVLVLHLPERHHSDSVVE